MPYMFHYSFCLLEDSFLEWKEVVDVQRGRNFRLKKFTTGLLKQALLKITLLDNGLEVLEINQFEVSKFLPPTLDWTNYDVVCDQLELDLIFSCNLAVMRALVIAYRVTTVLNLSLSRCDHLVRQHKDMQPSTLIGRSKDIVHNRLLHRSLVR